MSKHDHASCEHDVAWCRHCDTIYCKSRGCSMEWKPPCNQMHYPFYYTIGQTVRTNPWQWPNTCLSTAQGAISGGHASAQSATPASYAEAAALACSHHAGVGDGGG